MVPSFKWLGSAIFALQIPESLRYAAHMINKAEQKARGSFWLLLLPILPILYVFSVPPLEFLTAKPYADSRRSPEMIQRYAMPYSWLRDNTFLEGALEGYSECWWDALY